MLTVHCTELYIVLELLQVWDGNGHLVGRIEAYLSCCMLYGDLTTYDVR